MELDEALNHQLVIDFQVTPNTRLTMTSKILALSTAVLIYASAAYAEERPVYRVAIRPSFSNYQNGIDRFANHNKSCVPKLGRIATARPLAISRRIERG